MKAAVYDRYWTTLGGGERYAASIARALLERGADVDLFGFDPVAPAVMSDRLGVDLRDTQMVLNGSEHEVSSRSADYDLFVNVTYLSSAVNLARYGLFAVHFPGSRPTGTSRLLARAHTNWSQARRRPVLRWVDGLHRAENEGTRAWTNGLARLLVWFPSGGEVSLRLSALHCPPGHQVNATVKAGARTVFHGLVEPQSPVPVVVPCPARPPHRPVPIVIASDTFVPARTFGTVDDRQLGLLVTDLRANGRPWPLQRTTGSVGTQGLAYLDTYDAIAANSRYTAEWISQLWGRACEVLYPPVTARPRGPKEPMILAVGRFFDPRRGHSKKQVELVRAFRELVRRGLRGWSLHLVGGCTPEDRDYAMAVKRAAAGLPVFTYFNANTRRLDDLYSRAALFWHAAGFQENVERNPDRFEHFGISVAEGVTAGCIPLVYALGGQAEIVADVPHARVWHSLEELVAVTAELTDAFDRGERLDLSEPLAPHPWGSFDDFSASLDALITPEPAR